MQTNFIVPDTVKAFRLGFFPIQNYQKYISYYMWICIKLKRSSYWEKLGTTVLEHKHEKSIKSIFYEQPLRTQPLKSPSSLFIILRTSVMSADD